MGYASGMDMNGNSIFLGGQQVGEHVDTELTGAEREAALQALKKR